MALEDAGDEAEAGALLQSKRAQRDDTRSAADQARLKLEQFETAAQLRTGRLSQIGNETANWTRRRQGAETQVTTLDARLSDFMGQLEALNNAPSGLEERQAAIDTEIATARTAHGAASDDLAKAQATYREADKAQRLAAEALGGIREHLVCVVFW